MLLEDEYAQVNLIVPPQVYERFRAVVRGEPLLLVARPLRARRTATATSSSDELVSLAPLARALTDGADVHAALPARAPLRPQVISLRAVSPSATADAAAR